MITIKERFGLSGKIAVVTGGGTGIGRAISLGLMDAGAHVVICGRRLHKLEEIKQEASTSGLSCSVQQLDVLDEQQVIACMQKVKSDFGHLDILVCSAGYNNAQPAEKFELENWNRIIGTNLTGTFLCAREAGKIMIEQRSGKIIHILSTFAFVARNGRTAYASSKGGGMQLTKSLAYEWAKYGINVNALAPTATFTEMVPHLKNDPKLQQDMINMIPLGRIAEPEDMVGTAIFLASQASNFVTGQTILVDGGYTIW